MTDYTNLRELAEEANGRSWWTAEYLVEGSLWGWHKKGDALYIAAATPSVVLELLDEIERLKQQKAEIEQLKDERDVEIKYLTHTDRGK